MKNFKFFVILPALSLAASMSFAAENHIRFNESVYPYKDGFLLSNYGSNELNVKKDEVKGYILFYHDGKLDKFIKPDGFLKTPTARAEHDGRLFVCNGTELLCYDLKNLQQDPKIIKFSQADRAVNDIVLADNALYISVTNTNLIYKIDLKEKQLTPQKWIEAPSPNGIAVYKDAMYIASIPADYTNVNSQNVIYKVSDIHHPKLEKFNTTPRLYDGLAVADDGLTLYASDWATSAVYALNTKDAKETIVFTKPNLTPADIAVSGDELLIPDMLHHEVIIYKLKENKQVIVK